MRTELAHGSGRELGSPGPIVRGALVSDEADTTQLWLRELVACDEEAMREFWERYGPGLTRIADRRLAPAIRRRVGADDVVQSACRTFVRRLRDGQFELTDTERLWSLLVAITLTKVRQHVRFHLRHRRNPGREQPIGEGRETDATAPVPAPEPTPDEVVAFAEQLESLIDSMSDEEGDLVRLRLEGCTNDEAAERLGCSERTVRRLLKRVQTRLTAEFESDTD